MRAICIGHKPLAFGTDVPFVFVSPRPVGGQEGVVIPDGILGETFDGRIISEYTQLFYLADMMKAAGAAELVYLFQYRKFVGLREGGYPAENLPFSNIVSSDEATQLFPTLEELRAIRAPLLGPDLDVGMGKQYSLSHVIEDLVLFCVSLRHTVMDDATVAKFAAMPKMLPSPTLGVYPTQTFVRHMDVLREAWPHFYRTFYQPREGYQRRVGGFLLERLHSFLVLEDLQSGRLPGAQRGHHMVISDGKSVAGSA